MVKKRIYFAFDSDVRKLKSISGKPESYFLDFMKTGNILFCNNGYILFEPIHLGARIQDIFVQHKRQTVGTQLVRRLEKEIEDMDHLFIEISVPETNLVAALFLKSLGYTAKLTGQYYFFQKTLS